MSEHQSIPPIEVRRTDAGKLEIRHPLRQTHTYAILEVAPATFADIYNRLAALGPDYAREYFQEDDGKKLIVFGTIALRAEHER